MTQFDAEELRNVATMAAKRLDLRGMIGADELTTRQAEVVLGWWHQATKGLRFSSNWPGTLGVRAYHWIRSRHGADARGIDGVTRIDSDAARAMSEDLALHLDWVDVDPDLLRVVAADRELWLTELDVNGQFLNTCDVELGTGEPVLVSSPRTLDPFLRYPGYVRLEYPPVLGSALPFTYQALGRLEAGRVIAMPLARQLVKRGAELDASEVLVWEKSRRHLSAWRGLFRNAREMLAALSAGGNLGARIALGLVKETANVTVGGWMRSEDKNHSDLMRKDWSDQVIAEGTVRQLVALDKAGHAGFPACGTRRDAAWFIGDRDLEPSGLTIDKAHHPTGRDGQLGKWKRTRSVPVDDRLIEALGTGSPEMVVRVLTGHARSIQGQG